MTLTQHHNRPLTFGGISFLGGDFANPNPNPKPPRKSPTRLIRELIDEARTFFVGTGNDEGGFRHTWNRWRVIRNAEGTPVAVEVIYSEQRDAHYRVISTDKITLTDRDAYNFLKYVGDRNCEAFSREAQENANRIIC